MITVFFTFGLEDRWQFKGGWVEVHAPTVECAIAVFQAYYPRHPVWLQFYTADEFLDTPMAKEGNLGAYCHETITITTCRCH